MQRQGDRLRGQVEEQDGRGGRRGGLQAEHVPEESYELHERKEITQVAATATQRSVADPQEHPAS